LNPGPPPPPTMNVGPKNLSSRVRQGCPEKIEVEPPGPPRPGGEWCSWPPNNFQEVVFLPPPRFPTGGPPSSPPCPPLGPWRSKLRLKLFFEKRPPLLFTPAPGDARPRWWLPTSPATSIPRKWVGTGPPSRFFSPPHRLSQNEIDDGPGRGRLRWGFLPPFESNRTFCSIPKPPYVLSVVVRLEQPVRFL